MDSTVTKRSHTRRAFAGELAFIASATTLLAGGMNVDAATRVPHIGFLVGSEFHTLTNAFLDELRAKGFIDGQNVSVEKGDTGEMARSFARMNLDFIVAGALTYAIEVRDANPNMPGQPALRLRGSRHKLFNFPHRQIYIGLQDESCGYHVILSF